MDEILRVDGLQKHFVKKSIFSSKRSTVRAVDGVSFTVGRSDVLVLAGESGSGKSTIAGLILGSITPDSGTIMFRGRRIRHDSESLKTIRLQCQMVQQDPYDSINPRMRVSDIISEPLEIHGWGDKESRRTRVLKVLREVRLEPVQDIARKHPHMLSGGQRQRVVLARALALKPAVIIADEPVSMLDVSVRAEMLELMSGLQEKHGISFVYITHDLATARHFGKRIAVLYMGKIVEIGTVDDVLLHPRHPYTRALIDAISEPDPKNLDREKTVRIKDPPDVGYSQGCRFMPRCPYAMDKCAKEPELQNVGGGRSVACFASIEDMSKSDTICAASSKPDNNSD